MKFGSLFAGIGGFDLGFERAGMECAWQVEIDPYCQRVLARHWPAVERYGDVRECGAHNLAAVDLICGGFPCQPHSVAGKRKGKADDRNLWPEYRRIVAELRPRWVVGENVPGIITTMLDEVLSDLEGEGYATTTITLPAVAFDAPHRRDRVFVVAHNASGRCEGGDVPVRQGRSLEAAVDTDRSCAAVADAPSERRDGWQDYEGQGSPERDGTAAGCANVENTQRDGDRTKIVSSQTGGQDTPRPTGGISRPSWWATEPNVGRVADGVPRRVDRLRALGNAVVPQVAEWIGRRIMRIDTLKETD